MFGTVLFGRMNAGAGADRVPGPFINTLPVRVDVADPDVVGAVRAMQAQLAGLLVHEHAPLALAQQASGVPRAAPLFTSLFNYRHSGQPRRGAGRTVGGSGRLAGVSDAVTGGPDELSVAVSVDDTGTGFGLTVDAVAPGDPELVCALLHTAAREPGRRRWRTRRRQPLHAVEVLSTRRARAAAGRVERHGVMTSVRRRRRLVPELFEEQVVRDPGAVAVV